MIRKGFQVGMAVSALLLTSAYYSEAQNTYAAVHGTASDSSGAVLPDAAVTILNTSTGIQASTTTDGKGYYIFPQLAIGGPYTVSVSKANFSIFKSEGLMLNLNDNREIDAALKAGSESQSVDVQASAIQVETSDTELKQTISSKEILDLPLLGRDAVSLQKLSPGVVEASDTRGGYATNGNQSFNNSYLLDGNDVDDGPLNTLGIVLNPDAMAQEDIITGTAGPQYARNSGATIDQTVKAGTNSFHGDAFEFYRDTFLNDEGYAFGSTTPRPPFHQNVYGGTIGGPVFKNRVFFFLAYQGIRSATGTNYETPVFSSAQRGGDFSGDLAGTGATLSKNPVPFSVGTCAVGPGGGNATQTWANCLPTATVNPTSFNTVSANLLNKYVPAGNTVIGGSPYYSFSNSSSEGYDQGTIRIDTQLTSKDKLWASSIFQSSPTTNTLPFLGSTLPGFGEVDSQHFKLFSASETHIFSPTTLNEVRVNYFRFIYAAVSPQTPALPSTAGFQNITPQNTTAPGLPYVGVNGYFSLGFSQDGPQPRNDQNLRFADTFTKVIGNHNLSMGAFAERFTVNNPFYFDNNGAFQFNGAGSFTSGDPALDFVLGVPDSYAQNSGGLINARAWEGYAFFGDNWKVSKSFTANLALGYDIETPYESLQYGGEAITCWQNSNAESKIFPTAPPGLLYPGDPGCTNTGLATIQYNHFSPRVGFAWAPSTGPTFLTGEQGSNSFSVRGGFGIYFNRDIEEEALQNLAAPPFGLASQGVASAHASSPSFTNPYAAVTNDFSAPTPFPFVPPAVGSTVNFSQFGPLFLNNVAKNYDVPYVYSFNLNVERSLPSNIVLFLGYSGSLGRKLALTAEANPITAAGQAACAASTACIQHRSLQSFYFPSHKAQPAVDPSTGLPYFASVGQEYTDGSSNYNGLLVSVEKAPTHGLFLQLSYTYSHSLDDSSGYESSSGSAGRSYNYIPGFQYLNYGDSDFDARHRFTAAYVYSLPLPNSLKNNFISREALGGWGFSGITTLQTGFPIDVYQTGSNSLYCESSLSFYGCPDAPNTNVKSITGQSIRSTGRYFPVSDFSSEAIGTFGNAKRNFFHGPGFNYSNLNVTKDFKIDPEGTRYVQLRLEAYNAFNHANFANPGATGSAGGNNFSSSSFGKVTSLRLPSPNSASGDPQPGRAVQLGAKFYF